MLSLFKKNKPLIIHSSLTTDMHSHILPGLDDGSPDIITSLQLIKGLYDLGYRKLIATPHIIGDFYRNNSHTIYTALEEVKQACGKQGINIELEAAAEYMLDDHFLNLIKQKEPLLTITENFILTELPYSVQPMNVEELFFTIFTEGYQPILAHPERYFYYHNDHTIFNKFKELGVKLQVNALSVTGYYGPGVKKAAKFLFDNDLVDFIGTDLHHTRHLSALTKKQNQSIITKYTSLKMYNNHKELSIQN